ncbi:hypothetical protein [Providencia rettgeri]|uniref:hypothetical protein n=1 Tax=Providencia rettgeri TaxID=587 RepID=UPI0029407B58|nr:hypothetical protein [Providencia rettgeri]ELR5224493.1 hypothetical protein [Providencia rettgeri]MDX7324484.1 hypothetical protein [Providencia rettgeri]
MTKSITQRLDSAISSISHFRGLASCTAEELTSFHVSHLDELIDLFTEAKTEIEKLQSVKKQ